MADLNFIINSDLTVPRIYLEIIESGIVVSSSEINIQDYKDIIPKDILDQYSTELSNTFSKNIDLVVQNGYYINVFNDIVRDLDTICKIKTSIKTIQEEGNNV